MTRNGCAGALSIFVLLAFGMPGRALAQAGDRACPPVGEDITATAIAMHADPAVRRAISDMKHRYFRPNLRPGDTQGAKSLDQAADELAFSAMLDSASQSAPNAFTWFLAPPHRETGRAAPVPGSRIVFDNPDRIYRFTPLKGDRRYEIIGRTIDGKRPSFFLIEAVQSDNATGWGRPASVISSTELDFESDGGFRITVSPDRQDGGRNHLFVPANADALLVRDTLLDWSRELPVRLEIRPSGQVDAATCAAKDDVVRRIDTYARKQFGWINSTAPREDNRVGEAVVRKTAGAASWGVTAQGRYGLGKGQALRLTIDPLKARYLGLMVGDAWGRSIDYSQHTSSLNNSEVTPNPDGTITCIISAEFPGKFNWLDTGGIRHGLFMIRWESLDQAYDKATSGEPVKVELTTIAVLRQGLSRQAVGRAQRRHREFIATHRRAAYAARILALQPARAMKN